MQSSRGASIFALVVTLCACDPARDVASDESSSSGQPIDDGALPPVCLEWIGGQGGASAQEQCRAALDTECAGTDEQTCEAIVLGPTGTDNPMICVWAETWRGAAEGVCEDGMFGTACIPAEDPGDIGFEGPFHRSAEDETWIAIHDEGVIPLGYRSCGFSQPSPPATCECLASAE